MSTIPYWAYIFKLKKGAILEILSNYYTNQTIVAITRECNKERTYAHLRIFHKYLQQVTLLQFKVEDVKIDKEMLAFKLLLITKNRSNVINFTQHNIVNTWENNKIIKHEHTIISH